MVEEKKPDLMILDLMMPQISGIEVCRGAKNSNMPILMWLKGEEIDRILGWAGRGRLL
ncbi:MAG: response regulator [Christensenellales bacterium]